MTDIEFKKEMRKRFKKWYEMDEGGKYSDVDNWWDLRFDDVWIHDEDDGTIHNLSYEDYILESLFGPDFIKFLRKEIKTNIDSVFDNL